jgi:protein O-mannosyl-transferase
MSEYPEKWTLDGLENHFQAVHQTMPDHRFCWIIGAGASRSSGIPTGGELVDWWLKDLHLRHCNDGKKLEEWATEETLGIPKFKYENAPEFYPQIYDRRFDKYPTEGYAYLEHVMTGKQKTRNDQGLSDADPPVIIEPSPGYAMLAKILECQQHNVVITTNFDNLVADALQIYTNTYPLVCGHESLTDFVQVAKRRPTICKIHRDLFFAPFNNTRKLHVLHEAWSATLRSVFNEYTPIVIGYGGNDASLMGRLKSLDPSEIKGRLIWCYYKKHEPSDAIQKLVRELNGVLVPAPEFDILMILLAARIGIAPLDDDLNKRLEARLTRYQQRIDNLKDVEVNQLMGAIGKTKGWWWWQKKINQLDDAKTKETAYIEAIKHWPNCAEIHVNYALFLKGKKEFDLAELHYLKAIDLDSKKAITFGNYANFLTTIRKNHDEAERYYRKSLELDPMQATICGNFALFLTDIRKKYDEAEKYYRKSLELDPMNSTITVYYANFLSRNRKKPDEAEIYFLKALELASHDGTNNANYAHFLTNIRKKHDEAETFYRKSLELEPNRTFLAVVRKQNDEAEKYFRKALELDPKNNNFHCNLACVLLIQNKFHDSLCCCQQIISLFNEEENNEMRQQVLAETLLYQAIIEAHEKNAPQDKRLLELQNLLKQGFERVPSSFDALFDSLKGKLTTEQLEEFKLYSEAILDAEKAKLLSQALADLKASNKRKTIKKKTTRKRAKKIE